MKGVFIQKQLEFRLEVSGDGFRQGDTLKCTFTVKNHAAAAQSVPDLYLRLAVGTAKKIKERAADAFETLAAAELTPPAELAAGAQKSVSWDFPLAVNAVVSDKNQSLYLLFGSDGVPNAAGQLLVTVLAHAHVQAVLEILETSFQFVLKGQKTSDGRLVAKLKAPTSRRFSLVEEVNLGFRFEGETLDLNYLFKVKKFEASQSSSVGVTKVKKEFDQRLDPARYLLPGGFFNHSGVESALNEVMAEISVPT